MGFTPFAQFLPLSGGTISGPLTVTGATTLQDGISGGSSPGGPLQELVATTGAAGTALVNGTPTILTWAVPNDGQMHRFLVTATLHVTVAETGGAIALNFNSPDGTPENSAAFFAAGLGTGVTSSSITRLVQPGSTVTLTQGTALTVGAAVLFAEFWSS